MASSIPSFTSLFPKKLLVAPAHTPFTKTNCLNTSSIAPLAKRLVSQKFNAIFVAGTNGESFALSLHERKELLESWMKVHEVKNGDLKIIAHVSCASMGETVELARHAVDNGAHSVSWMAPSFFKPRNVSDCAGMLAEVAGKVPEVPVLYYHFPAFTGVNLKCSDVLIQARKISPNVQAAKFTDVDLADFQEGVQTGFSMLIGNTDEMLLPSLPLGACGGYSVSSMCGAGEVVMGIWEAYERGNLATANILQNETRELFQILSKHPRGFLAAGKVVAEDLGSLELGDSRVAAVLTKEEKKEVIERFGRKLEEARENFELRDGM